MNIQCIHPRGLARFVRPTTGASWVACARVPAACAAQVRIGAASACKAWHNGKQIVNSPAWRGYGLDQDKADVQLVQGDNLLVVKVVNSGAKDWSDWSVELRLTEAAGKPLDQVEYSLPHAAAAQ